MRFTYGFYFNGRTYGWKNKELYRMPYFAKGRAYVLRKLKPQKNTRGKVVYLIDNKPKSIRQLEAMTTKINFVINKVTSKHTPF